MQLTAENGFVIKDASRIVFDNVTVSVKDGVAPAKSAMKE